MASPFPGMDPYLENPDRWGGVHAALIAVLGELLTRQVAPRFLVDSKDHVYVIAPDDPGRPLVRPGIYVAETSGAVELPQPIEVRYHYLEVRDTADQQVVTTIQVLSPINKVPGSTGRQDFRHTRQQAWRATAHWIEIDLLRGGDRPFEVASWSDYYAALHRGGGDDMLEIWPIDLRDELPTIAVPLVPPLPDVLLDLQAAIETVYIRYRYDVILNYSDSPPPPPLDAADAAWAAERIRRWQAGTDTETGA